MVGASQTSKNVGGRAERRERGRRQTENNSLLMGVFFTIALGVGHMEQESLKLFISKCVCLRECEFPCEQV